MTDTMNSTGEATDNLLYTSAADNTTFDPFTQIFTILANDGRTAIPINVADVDGTYFQALASQASYGAQIGASLMMLCVVLVMTPRNRFARVTTLLNIAMLTLNFIRMLLLALWWMSKWFTFYAVFSGDFEFVPRSDYNLSAAGTALSLPITVLIEIALSLQAWSMIQLWPGIYKWSIAAVSAVIVLTVMGFKTASTILQIQNTLYGTVDLSAVWWVHQVEIVLLTTSICWFCFLFVFRLATHLLTHRGVLPSANGLSAMQVLVMTNGVLMLIPGMFSCILFLPPSTFFLRSMG
jgi:pheromone alpha factor receptor